LKSKTIHRIEAAPAADLPTPAIALPSSAERYLVNLETQRKLSAHTLTSYRHELEVLTRLAADDAACGPIEQLKDAQIRRYAAKLHARGLGARSIARALSAWRGYFNWLAQYEDGVGNPVADVRPPKLPKRLPKALSETLTMQLLDAPRGDEAVEPSEHDQGIARRDTAIYELFYSSGLRLAELVALDIAHVKDGAYRSSGWIDLASDEVTVTGKGNKRRTVPIGSKARAAIEQWLAMRSQWVKADPHALFLSTRGERLSGRSIQNRLKAHARKAGIPANVHPHVLRHSFASHMLQASGDLRAVQELLGHSSIASTQVYTSLDFKRLAEVYDAAHPRARRK
jgi:integrase/recombinase XerC